MRCDAFEVGDFEGFVAIENYPELSKFSPRTRESLCLTLFLVIGNVRIEPMQDDFRKRLERIEKKHQGDGEAPQEKKRLSWEEPVDYGRARRKSKWPSLVVGGVLVIGLAALIFPWDELNESLQQGKSDVAMYKKAWDQAPAHVKEVFSLKGQANSMKMAVMVNKAERGLLSEEEYVQWLKGNQDSAMNQIMLMDFEMSRKQIEQYANK